MTFTHWCVFERISVTVYVSHQEVKTNGLKSLAGFLQFTLLIEVNSCERSSYE